MKLCVVCLILNCWLLFCWTYIFFFMFNCETLIWFLFEFWKTHETLKLWNLTFEFGSQARPFLCLKNKKSNSGHLQARFLFVLVYLNSNLGNIHAHFFLFWKFEFELRSPPSPISLFVNYNLNFGSHPRPISFLFLFFSLNSNFGHLQARFRFLCFVLSLNSNFGHLQARFIFLILFLRIQIRIWVTSKPEFVVCVKQNEFEFGSPPSPSSFFFVCVFLQLNSNLCHLQAWFLLFLFVLKNSNLGHILCLLKTQQSNSGRIQARLLFVFWIFKFEFRSPHARFLFCFENNKFEFWSHPNQFFFLLFEQTNTNSNVGHIQARCVCVFLLLWFVCVYCFVFLFVFVFKKNK